MRHDPVTEPAERSIAATEATVHEPSRATDDDRSSAAGRRLAMVLAGHRRDAKSVAGSLEDPDPGVRAAALGALARCGRLDPTTLVTAMTDPAPEVRRRACDLAAAPGLGSAERSALSAGAAGDVTLDAALVRALADDDPLVVEAACWATGERRQLDAIGPLARAAAGHLDARCREAAVAALGAIGDPAALPAVLAALDDRPAVRRRATVALAAFEGPEVDDALRRSAADRDWQVREVAEILRDPLA